MYRAARIALPSSSHFIYIPVIFVIGIVLGFIVGSKATRDAIALEQKQGRRTRGAQGRARRPPRPTRAAKAGASSARDARAGL